MATKKETTKKELETSKAQPARTPLANAPVEQARKSAPAQAQAAKPPAASMDRIAKRAYELYAERGGEHGRDQDDWLRAEQEVGKDGDSSTAH